jgi:hypothetical protein
MDAMAKKQRRKGQRKPADSSLIHVEMKDETGISRFVPANLVDVIGGGCGLALMTLLKPGSTVILCGKFDESRTLDYLKAGVKWCVAKSDGTFRAGLEFLDNRSTFVLDEEQARSINPVAPNYYEVMQLSPNADTETISRVYRMLAFRYHPDNTGTGNSEMFLRLSEAYDILSDPQKRASYDAAQREAKRPRGKNLSPASPSDPANHGKGRSLDVTAAYLEFACPSSTVSWEG